jgi:transcription elongation factor GreA
MTEKVPITTEGKRALEDELRHLKSVERPRVIEAIAIARAHGDLSENADYSAAREKQSFIEGRILEIGDKLARAEVIDPAQIKSDRIVFGATVTVIDDASKEIVYQIVGETEGDLSKGKLSIKAPLARPQMGKMVGDEATLRTPKGESVFEISKIEYK